MTPDLRDPAERDRLRAICDEMNATVGSGFSGTRLAAVAKWIGIWNPETAKAALALIEEQAGNLSLYGDHLEWCSWWSDPSELSCSCGWLQIQQAACAAIEASDG